MLVSASGYNGDGDRMIHSQWKSPSRLVSKENTTMKREGAASGMASLAPLPRRPLGSLTHCFKTSSINDAT